MSKTDIVVLGAGGMGREAMWLIESSKKYKDIYNILGFVDDSCELAGLTINGQKVIGDISWLLSRTEDIAVVIGLGDTVTRKNVYEKLSANPVISFPNIVADDVIMSDYVKMGKGCIICSGNILTVNIEIGDFLISNLNCTICHDSVIGNFVTLNPSVNISGNVTLADSTNVGVGSKIIQGKSVGEGSVIGAGAVVVTDLPANCTAVGVPAKPIKFH